MKRPPRAVAVALAFVAIPFLSFAEVREWTRATDGKKISAEYIEMVNAETVKVRIASGQTFEIPLSSLVQADRDFVKSLNQPKEMAVSEGGKPAIPDGEVVVTLSGVHLGCKECEEAAMNIPNHDKIKVDPAVKVEASRSEGKIVIHAPSGKSAQTALRAVLGSGFYGTSDHPSLKIPDLKEDDFTTTTMVVRDVILRSSACEKAFKKAVESVDGVKDVDAKQGSNKLTVKGDDFKPYEVMKALREAGFGGSFQ